MIEEKMKILGTRNFGAYARKIFIDGFIIKVDYSEQRKLAAEVNKIGVNINQDKVQYLSQKENQCKNRHVPALLAE